MQKKMTQAKKEKPAKASPALSKTAPRSASETVSEKEVNAYIYQTIAELQAFATPETVIMCLSKKSLDLLDGQMSVVHNGQEFTRTQLKNMNRIALVLKDGEAVVEAEGLASDVYDAIREAKEKLFQLLSEIQNDVLSAQDRQIQIESARPVLLH